MYISLTAFIILFLIAPNVAFLLGIIYLCYLYPTIFIPLLIILLIIAASNN